jgi:hypothetical protein
VFVYVAFALLSIFAWTVGCFIVIGVLIQRHVLHYNFASPPLVLMFASGNFTMILAIRIFLALHGAVIGGKEREVALKTKLGKFDDKLLAKGIKLDAIQP